MKENTPKDQKIKIAAVFISHPHVDHMDGFVELVKYSSEIECEALYFNFGAFASQNCYSESTLNTRRNNAVKAAEALGAKVYITRTGQKITLSDATFEILWNPEDIGNFKVTDYNDACVIVRMTVGNKKAIFLGDSRDKQSPAVLAMYKENIKCDIITVSHHGYTGAPIGLYLYANPSIVFWPNVTYPSSADNTQLLALSSVKNHYLAGKGQIIIELD